MSRKAFLAATLMVSLGLFGQRSGTPSSGSSTPASRAPASGVPTTRGAMGGLSGQAAAGQTNTPSANIQGTPTLPEVMAGPVTTGVTGGTFVTPPLLATPIATFDAPQPTAGVTDAGRAGISDNAPINTGVTSTLAPTTMVYSTVPAVNVVVVPPAGTVAPSASAGGGTLINDLGPSYYSDALPPANNVSVGEVAAQFKAFKATVNARVLTNDDVQKMVGNNTGVTMAKNMPPLGPGATPQNGTSQSATSQTMTAQSSSPATQPGAQTSGPGQPRAGTPPPVNNSQGQPAGSTATAGTSTTPQINQNQQSNDTQEGSRLPTTSTFLPLLGLLGLASGGIGLWFRKFRR